MYATPPTMLSLISNVQKPNFNASRQALVKPKLEVYLDSKDEGVKDSVSIIPDSSSSSRTRKRSDSTQSDDFTISDPTPVLDESIVSRKRRRLSGSIHVSVLALAVCKRNATKSMNL